MVIEAIQKHRSMRMYKTDAVSEDVVNEIIKAGQFAPTAHGTGAVEFVVITDVKMKKDIFDIVGQDYVTEAPVLIMPVATDATVLPVQDISVATQNMLLQATDLGLGSVWKHVVPEWAGKIKEMLSIPEGYHVINMVPIGLPNDPDVIEHADDDFKIEKIHREKW